jgi:hypothetical protein
MTRIVVDPPEQSQSKRGQAVNVHGASDFECLANTVTKVLAAGLYTFTVVIPWATTIALNSSAPQET